MRVNALTDHTGGFARPEIVAVVGERTGEPEYLRELRRRRSAGFRAWRGSVRSRARSGPARAEITGAARSAIARSAFARASIGSGEGGTSAGGSPRTPATRTSAARFRNGAISSPAASFRERVRSDQVGLRCLFGF